MPLLDHSNHFIRWRLFPINHPYVLFDQMKHQFFWVQTWPLVGRLLFLNLCQRLRKYFSRQGNDQNDTLQRNKNMIDCFTFSTHYISKTWTSIFVRSLPLLDFCRSWLCNNISQIIRIMFSYSNYFLPPWKRYSLSKINSHFTGANVRQSFLCFATNVYFAWLCL